MEKENNKFNFGKEMIIALDKYGHFYGFFEDLSQIENFEYKHYIDKILVYQLKEKFKFFMKNGGYSR